jgi:type II secretory pathway pseudopilin PulG
MGEVALAIALMSVVTASLFLGLRSSRDGKRDPRIDNAWTSYSEALQHARRTFDEIDGRSPHPTAALADYLQKRQDEADHKKPARLD